MNSFSLKQITSKSIDLKSFAIIRCAKRTKTQRKEHSKNDVGGQSQEPKHQLMPLIDNSKEYQTIFSKRKRLEYSGYKQCNLNKSKFIRFQEDKQKNRHQPPRNYEMNIKNIAKLRKRYSLEPSQVKFSFSEEKNLEKNSALKIKEEAECEIAISERKHHNNLRQLMKNFIQQMNHTKRKVPLEKFDIEEQREAIQSTNHTNSCQDPEHFHRYKDEKVGQEYEHQENPLETADERNISQSSNLKNLRKIDHRIRGQYFQSVKKGRLGRKMNQKEVEEAKLCGWESQTQFY